MKDLYIKFKNSNFLKILKDILSSKYLPFVTAAMTLLCYYLGLDLLLIYYIVIVGCLIFLLCDDLSPIISLFLFINIVVSKQNSPSFFSAGFDFNATSDYYFQPAHYIQIIVLVALLVLAGVFRLGQTVVKRKFTIDVNFYGFAAFCITLLLNGLFSSGYTPKNLLFGFILTVLFFGIYCVLKDNLAYSKETFEKIAWGFFALSIVLLIELLVAYITTDGLIIEVNKDRSKLTFGWGIWNTMGMLLALCIPAVFYLAIIKKYGFVFTVYSALLFAAVILSCSRQSIIGVAVIYPICLVVILLNKKDRIANICVIVAEVIAGITLLIVYRDTAVQYFIELFKKLFADGELTGNGRVQIWREAISYFENDPAFGAGFFVNFSYQGDTQIGFIPLMCHNTIFQLLSSCGIVGFTAYAIHRGQSIVSYFKNVTFERTYIALIILAILIMSLFDNHLFNVFPTIIYGCLIAVLFGSEKKKV